MAKFKLYWKTKTNGIQDTEVIEGETIAKAFAYAGYSSGALNALDWYEEIKETKVTRITPELASILIACYKKGINSVTFPAHSFDEEYELSCDDKDYVTFHRGLTPLITDKLLVCSKDTTTEPIWKDWYMTINYHS